MKIDTVVDSRNNELNNIYGIVDVTTNKLISNITNPSHKFWEIKGHCINALLNYKRKYDRSYYKSTMINPENLRIVKFKLLVEEVKEVN